MSRLPAADAALSVTLNGRLDLRRTLEPLAHGRGDPTIRLLAGEARLAFRTPQGPATLQLRQRRPDAVEARAWGPGAAEALDGVPALIGARDDPDAFTPRHDVLRELARRLRGVRLTASGRPFDALLPAILEQKVTGVEARAAYRALIRRHGERAPGPFGLQLAPSPQVLAALPSYAFHPLGVERRRAELIRRCAGMAPRLARAAGSEAASRILANIPGIGPWTRAEVVRVAYGDPDAVSIGDYHLPSVVAWALAGERTAGDERMLSLLEPYSGQRARVQRLLELGGIWPPRRGPRMATRQIAAI
jgi:3-methyladenine DNA glycosylase/8-oxoguanine DNA glycosylase